jgi:hypothetical protein
LIYAAFFLEVGLLLVVLPWSAFWARNYFVEAWPLLQPLVTNNFVRGGVTGLGLVNLVSAFAEIGLVLGARSRQELSGRP